jgi:endonuclease-3
MPRESKEQRRKRALRIVKNLFRTHPDAHCALHHRGPYQLLVATILSAQCTDKVVNTVTPELFRRYPSPAHLAAEEAQELERLLRPTGFFRQKAKTLLATCDAIAREHGGQIPKTMEELTRLPGVGRKTANVILGNAFGTPGIVVDTHVGRLARRMGLSKQTDPVRVEHDLMDLVPEKDWTQFSHAMIFHGRRVCGARNPQCELCSVYSDCPFPQGSRRKTARGTSTRSSPRQSS